MQNLIRFFINKHLLVNFIFVGVLFAGTIFWYMTPKEEMPDFTHDAVRVTVNFPGASANEVEYFVTRPMENELKTVSGVYRIQSTSTQNRATIIVELEKGASTDQRVISEVRDAVYSTRLPTEVDELPNIRQFRTSQKAIIDIGLYFENKEFLDPSTRKKLHRYMLALENRLISLDQINSVDRSGFRKEEIQVLVKPAKLMRYQIPLGAVSEAIRKANVRHPAGELENQSKDKVTVEGELRSKEALDKIIVQGSFEGYSIKLTDLASIREGFEKTSNFLKVNGREGIILNVRKSGNVGILEAIDKVRESVRQFERDISNETFKVVLLDDESRDIRNRIDIISSNGLIGFTLILITLFFFLNFRTGVWVALGIPFTFCMTLIAGNIWGLTINNVTLAAVIIVMGMIVDDAIVVSENITRLRRGGMPSLQAAVEGTGYVLMPIVASITTTCIAFLPLLTFSGRISILSDSIPPIVIFMLAASFLESIFILPAHLHYDTPNWLKAVFSLGLIPLFRKLFPNIETSSGKRLRSKKKFRNKSERHWFDELEVRYSGLLERLLLRRGIVIFSIIFFTIAGYLLFRYQMNFTVFPRTEADQVRLRAETPNGFTKEQTAQAASALEQIFEKEIGKNVIGFRTQIANTGYRSTPRENALSIRVELINPAVRKTPLSVLMARWRKEIKEKKGFNKVRFSKGWFGSDTSTPIEILVKENNNEKRVQIAEDLVEALTKTQSLENIEIDMPYQALEYRIIPDRRLMTRLGVRAADLGSSLRAVLEGEILHKALDENSEERNLRLSVEKTAKKSLYQILSIPISNEASYLVPIRNFVQVKEGKSPSEIIRLNGRRILKVTADLKRDTEKTPLNIAGFLDENIFPKIIAQSPSTSFSYEGEIQNARETTGFFPFAMVGVLFSIYMILAIQFNSLIRPLLIMSSIIPALAFVVLVFYTHGLTTYGFFSLIGILGLSGVLVNDGIILIKKLDSEISNDSAMPLKDWFSRIAQVSSTRLKAVLLTTMTTAFGLFPTAYGLAGFDAMLAEMMLALSWGLILGTVVIMVLLPALYSIIPHEKKL